MFTRMSPYGFGMYVALLHVKDVNHDYLKNKFSIFFEWLAFILMICLAYTGAGPIGFFDKGLS
jgi:hypothetical protein